MVASPALHFAKKKCQAFKHVMQACRQRVQMALFKLAALLLSSEPPVPLALVVSFFFFFKKNDIFSLLLPPPVLLFILRVYCVFIMRVNVENVELLLFFNKIPGYAGEKERKREMMAIS